MNAMIPEGMSRIELKQAHEEKKREKEKNMTSDRTETSIPYF